MKKTMVTINDVTFYIREEAATGKHYIYDSSMARQLGESRTFEGAVRKCESLSGVYAGERR